MRLSTRLLLGYGYLAGLLLLSAAGAALAFHQLGDNISAVLGENFRSVQAGIRMLESLERQDSAALSLLLGHAEGRARMADADETFGESLAAARANITIEDEAGILDRIEQRFDDYRDVRDEVLAAPAEDRLGEYERRAFGLFEQVKAGVRELIDVNHAAMQRADEHARSAATTNAALHGLLVAVALLSLAPLSASMRRHVLSRLEEIGAVSQAISAGDLGRRLDERHNDELGQTARQLNRVLDRHQVLEAELGGHRSQMRGLTQALLLQLPLPAVLFSTSGEVMESTLEPGATEAIRRAAAGHAVAMEEPRQLEFEAGDCHVRMVPLHPVDRPQCAWLALVQEPD
jgi:HAMP domain-containing protein